MATRRRALEFNTDPTLRPPFQHYNQPIYTIMTLQRLDLDSSGWADNGDCRVVGWFPNKETALKTVRENAEDIADDGFYRYALVEEIEPGLYSRVSHRWFFRYDTEQDKFYEIPEPEGYKRFTGFAIG